VNRDRKSNPSGDEDAALVAAVLGGDRSAFDRLVRRHQRRVTGRAYRLLGDADDAQESAQETFLRAYRKLSTLSDPKRFGSWLMRIATNQALNYRRGRAVRKTLRFEDYTTEDDPADGASNRPDPRAQAPGERVSAKELDRRIQQLLTELPDKQRQALVLFSMEKVPQKEVAKLLGLSVEAVKWHVFSARKKLKERLGEYL
jgi:RNA polymerase sigma-70 factor (ECF subfamily)